MRTEKGQKAASKSMTMLWSCFRCISPSASAKNREASSAPPNEGDKSIEERLEDAWELFWFSLMFVMFSVYPFVSRIILSTFSCLDLGTDGEDLPPFLLPIRSPSHNFVRDATAEMPKVQQLFSLFSTSLSPAFPGHFMRSDFREECPLTNKTSFAFVWSIIFTILIPAGCPLFIAWVLYRNGIPKKAQKKREEALLRAVFEVGDIHCIYMPLAFCRTSLNTVSHLLVNIFIIAGAIIVRTEAVANSESHCTNLPPRRSTHMLKPYSIRLGPRLW